MSSAVRNTLIRLRARPDTLCASQGRTVLATDRDGFVLGGADHGLFVHETRLLSRWRYLVDGQPVQANALSSVEQHSWHGYYVTHPPRQAAKVDRGSGQVPAHAESTLDLRVSRFVGEGVHEDMDLTNYSQQATSFVLAIEVEADFADLGETRGERRQHGELTSEWSAPAAKGAELGFRYRAAVDPDTHEVPAAASIERAVRIRVPRSSTPASYRDGQLRFEIALDPRASWHACIEVSAEIDGTALEPLYGCRSFLGTDNSYDRLRSAFVADSTRFVVPGATPLVAVVLGALDQAKRDLASLRLYDLDRDPASWTMAAGLPQYVALFGRDTLTASWQAALLGPGMMDGTLARLAGLQGRADDPWRDEEPGRMLHEAHTGPLSALGLIPQGRYYGSITTSGFYPFVVSALWHWTGDEERVRPCVEPALRALRWLDERSDRDRDGFYEYQTKSARGVRHQGWKDSGNAIVYDDGTPVEPPIATCEEQAFVYAAKLHLSETLRWLGQKEESRRLFHEASELKKRFGDAFWMEEEGFVAGHCLASGILDDASVRRVADRLFEPDLFSGWGIRTLSDANPAFNPYSYHRGSVWPVEHGSFALGLMRYGLHDHLERLCRAQFEATALFDGFRLPELFSGHARGADHPHPALYPGACSPQAWSASAVFSFLQALLGLYPYAPLDALVVDPHLPEWLPEIHLTGLRVGTARVSLRFHRKKDGSSAFEVLDLDGSLSVIRQPSPWSLTGDWGERLRDLLTSTV